MILKLSSVYLLFATFQEISALYCLQCSGWYGRYAPGSESVSTCDNPNNACTSSNFCVRIIDPIFKNKHYKTFKADCYTSNTFASLSNTSTIVNGKCYNYTDGGSPPKTYLYCFCNDKGAENLSYYCNGTSQNQMVFSLLASFAAISIISSLTMNSISDEQTLKKLVDDLEGCEETMRILQCQLKIYEGFLSKVQANIESKVPLKSLEEKVAENIVESNGQLLTSEKCDVESLSSELGDFNPFKSQPNNEQDLEKLQQIDDERASTASSVPDATLIEPKKKKKSKARRVFRKVRFWKKKKDKAIGNDVEKASRKLV
ncbi:hypothetical protein M3Y97_00469800 [Aphelenchoides bicaudatus]|nr:hypothetical protein M3Y97_00469800 [Aphelenchoides bicaudatus]